MEEPPPVVLGMDKVRRRSIKGIRRALWYSPGVTGVSASPRTDTVVVRGDMRMDAEELRRRLEDYMERPVSVLSDGGRPERPHYFQHEIMPYYDAPPAAYRYPYAAPPADYRYQQHAPPPAYHYQYAPSLPPPQTYYRPHRSQYGGLPSVFDDTIPGNICTIM